MAAPKRRRWYSLSLRTLMVGMTLASVWFWWYFHHRGNSIAEKARLQKLYGTPSGSVGDHRPAVELEFHDVLFAWRLPNPKLRAPDSWWWLRPITAPRLHSVDLNIRAGLLTDESVNLARSAPCVRVRAHGLPRNTLERIVSAHTRELYIYPRVSTRDLAVLTQAPKLQVLSIRCPDDSESVRDDCSWLSLCRELNTIYAEAHDPIFLSKLGQQLGGVERLHVISADATILVGLAQWSRLRHLSIEYAQMDDRLLAPLEVLGPHLETLEIYHADTQRLTPAGLTTLQHWSGLRNLKLGDCQLTAPHVAALAQLPQLRQLSIRTQHLTPSDLQPLRLQLQLVDLDDDR